MGGQLGNRCLLRNDLQVKHQSCHALDRPPLHEALRCLLVSAPPCTAQLADIVGDRALYALLLETTFRNLRIIAVMLQTDLLCMIFPPQLRS